jgi:hypothetical protein
MSTPRRFRYKPLPAGQPVCTACWREEARVRLWLGKAWVAAYCEACADEHRRRHVPPAQRDLFEEEEA